MVKAKKNLSEFAQQKRAWKDKKQLNPFEIHINREKQKVLGRKNKNDRGLPGISRAKAINKRKQSLLQEYKMQNKDNVFLDKRIGERDSAMSVEDKAMARFARQLKKMHKKNMYNLNDDEILTHRGHTLEEIEKFDDPRSEDEFSDEENSGKLDKNFVDGAHFGGGLLSKPETTSSRKDLIDQLIAESKKRKAEKQKIREQTIDLTEKLDSEWRDLLPLMSASKKTDEDATETTKADAYDITVRKLKFEVRGNPSDKLKSEEEIIQEEKERLEALEADRLARMKGCMSETNNKSKHRSADDLDDGYLIETIAEDTDDKIDDNTMTNNSKDSDSHQDEISSNSSNAEDRSDPESNSENIGDEDSEDNFSDLEESESSSEDENKAVKKHVMFSNGLTEETKQTKQHEVIYPKPILKQNKTDIQNSSSKDKQQEIINDLLKRKEVMEKTREELPYAYSVPESFEELKELLETQTSEYQSIIVDRILKCNHWTLETKNKEKLSKLFVYLLQYIHDCASPDNADDLVRCFQIFDRLCPYLYDLTHMNPENAKICIQDIIREKHDEFEANKRKYPDMDTLIFFKLVSLLFPTSDFRHPVVTPCLVFMSQILLRSRIKTRSDVARGLFICTLILEYAAFSKRFLPSAINFLRGIVYTATSDISVQKMKIIPPFKAGRNFLVLDEKLTDMDIDPNGAHMMASDLILEEMDNGFKIRALLTAVNLIKEFKNQLQELEAVYSIFEPIHQLLKVNKFKTYPLNLKKHIKTLRKEIEVLQNAKLKYIVLEKKLPKPLRQYEPKIMTVYDCKQHRPMSKEKAEREKLLHKYKKEMKGAMREIRRDNSFLAKVRISQQIKSNAESKRKVKEIFGEIAMQQSELKKMRKK
ncbi:nucleolar protein 14 homolog [Odontomachus brunneus]|uniref:nucleolar protein 14 homolog n=1 Tax=Odontomachus brunneus TaxID=486640 RepID=UPI0013F1A0A1|nr:nucleolar protein 14 homolog [Odontomachus brunneus]XP_032678557.1 nucleolar protein 14 homolog [Odontomachus brunneus]